MGQILATVSHPLPSAGHLIEFPLRSVPLVAIPLLKDADELVPPPGRLVEVVVGQLPPLLLHLALELLPVALDLIPVHTSPRRFEFIASGTSNKATIMPKWGDF